MKEVLKALGLLTLRCLVLSLVLAYLMGFIEGLRTVGISPFVFPFTAQSTPRLMTTELLKDPLALAIDNFLYAYNCAFPGACRLGNGVGLIAGAFWSLHSTAVKPFNGTSTLMERCVIGLTAGFIIGFRMMFMISSKPMGVLVASIVGMLSFCIYMLVTAKKPVTPRIPIVPFR